jgi:hypothetical protein
MRLMAKCAGKLGNLALLCAAALFGAQGCAVSAVAVGASDEQSAPVGPPGTVSENPDKPGDMVTNTAAPIEQPENIDIKRSLSGLTLKELITRLTENEITLVDEKVEIYQAEEERYFPALIKSRKGACPTVAFAYKNIKCTEGYYSIKIQIMSILTIHKCMSYEYIINNIIPLYIELQPETFNKTDAQKNPRGNILVHPPVYSSFISEKSGTVVVAFPSMHEEHQCAAEIFIDQVLPETKE